MSAKKNKIVYRLPKQGFDEVYQDEWSDMAICDAYDAAVGGELTASGKKDEVKDHLNGSLEKEHGDHRETPAKQVSSKKKENTQQEGSMKLDQNKKREEDVLKPGDKCIALYSEDGLYYECTIKSVNQQQNNCLVEYDGYGNIELVNSCDVYTKEQWKSVAKDKRESSTADTSTSSTSTQSCSSTTGTSSSSTEGTSSDVTQDIYSKERMKKKRGGCKHGNHTHSADMKQNLGPPLFGQNPFMGLPPPSLLASNGSKSDISDDALSSMLLSWYMAGYHTGYYQGLNSRGGRKNRKKR